MSKASLELVTRLELRKLEVESLRASLLKLGQLSDEFRLQVRRLSSELQESSTRLEASLSTQELLQTDLTATLNSLDESRQQLLKLKAASDAAAAEDARALAQARAERDAWMAATWSAALLAVVAFGWGLSR